MAELPHIAMARSYIGTREIPGAKHNSKIVRLWELAKTKFRDDETPWCSGYVCGVLEEVGYVSARTGWARGNLNWGVKIPGPAYGAIVVFSRGPNAGHVGFVVGRDRQGNIMVLGGNQDNAVNIKAFPTTRVLGYRWPRELKLPATYNRMALPLLKSDGTVSTNEA